MNKLILIFNICFIFVAFAQKPYQVTTSKEIELQNKSFADNIIPNNKGVCLVTSKNTGSGNFKTPSVVDTKLSFFGEDATYIKTLDLTSNDKSDVLMESYNNNGKLVYIDAIYNGEYEAIATYYNELSNNGKVIKSTLMNHIPGEFIYLSGPNYFFKTIQSPNYKKILSIAIYKKGDIGPEYIWGDVNNDKQLLPIFATEVKNKMSVGVIDENGEILFENDIVFKAPEGCNKISIEDYEINDRGDVFLILKQYIKGKKEKVAGDANYKLSICAITNKGKSTKVYAIDTKEYFCKKPNLVVSNTGNVYCVGFLSGKKIQENLTGVLAKNVFTEGFVGFFTQKLGADLNEVDYKFNKITNEDILKYNSKFKYKDDEISGNFIINYIYETTNAVHISAEYYIMNINHNMYGATTTTYFYKDILYFELNKDLQLKQIYAIPKYQRASSTQFLGYKMFMHNDKPYFIFNDNKMNADKDIDEKLKKVAHSYDFAPMMVYHNGTTWVRERLFEKEEVDDNILMTRAVQQIDANNIFLPFQRKGNYILGKLTFTK
ncbi:MAG: hypothetical protein IPK18_03970 [Sphingobacteriales bacterium]|jgi:hypothetical protein|nr:MAG: hypothetical protein IPK18_03970 [Sphingobacteriales bacterium]